MGEEQRIILKMVEDGKITADEGIALLKQLEKTEETSPSTKTEDNNKGKEHEGKYSQPSFTDRFVDFIDHAVKKIKDIDLDFNFGSSEEVDLIFQHREDKVNTIDISLENGSLTINPWDESDVRVECKVKVYKVKDAEEARKEFMDKVTFEVTNGGLKFKSPMKSMKVNTVVYVPRNDYDKVALYTFNGQIDGGNFEAVDFAAKTVNGRISFKQLDSKKVLLETTNGKIVVDQIVADHYEAKTVNGSVQMNGSGGEVVIETLNGSIKYNLQDAEKAKGTFKTTTGSIRVNVPENMKTEGECKTVVGGITCDLPKLKILDERKEVVSKSLSFVSNEEVEPVFVLQGETRTGSIHLEN